jgi:hypothetical protein
VLVTEQGKTPLRVPVYAAAKPTSATSARSVATSADATALRLSGTGFAQGSGDEAFTALVSVAQLGATSPKLAVCSGTQTSGCLPVRSDGAGDLRYVGAGSTPTSPGSTDYSNGWLYFAVNTWGQSATVGHSVIPYVVFDTTGDGVPDYEVDYVYYRDTDEPLAALYDLSTGQNIDLEPINMAWGDLDTNVFDTDTYLIPVWPAAIGVTPGTTSFPISYQVGTYDPYYTGADIDDSPAVTYDVVDPAVAVSDPLYVDQGGTTIPYTLGSDATRSTRALVLHLHGAPGHRAGVVGVTGEGRSTPPGKTHANGSLRPSPEHWQLGSVGD